jgi:hypothetical protein
MTARRTKIMFEVLGNFDPDRISSIVGIQPDKTWEAGHRIGKSKLLRKESGWCLVKEGTEWHVEELFTSLWKTLEPKMQEFKALGNQVKCEFQVSIQISASDDEGEMPSLYFSPISIQRMGELNASVDIDIS